MRERNARHKLEKRMYDASRDQEGGTGNARGLGKAVRAYGKAVIDSALEDMAEDDAENRGPCIMCGTPCVSLCCSKSCHDEAILIELIPSQDKAAHAEI